MEVEGCQPTASEPTEILATGTTKVRLPSVASMAGSVFSESRAEESREMAYHQDARGLGPSTLTKAPETESSPMLQEVECKEGAKYAAVQSNPRRNHSMLSSRNGDQNEPSGHQGSQILQVISLRSATPRHSVAIPLKLITPKAPRMDDEPKDHRRAHGRPLNQSDNISPTEQDIPDLIIPRSRDKGKEIAFDDRRLPERVPFGTLSKPVKPLASGTEGLLASMDYPSKESSQGPNKQQGFRAQLSTEETQQEELVSKHQNPASHKAQGQACAASHNPEQCWTSSLKNNETNQDESRDNHPSHEVACVEDRACAQKPTTASSSPENYGERPAILAQLMLKFNVRDMSRPELEAIRESDGEAREVIEECEAEENAEEDKKLAEASVGVCAEQSRRESGEAKFYYPKQKECDLAPSSAPLVSSASNNSLSSCEGDLLHPRKVSSVPLPPKQAMLAEESSCPDDDALSSQPIQGIIMGGPSLSPTRQGSYATHGNPGIVRRHQIPSMHGVVEDATACTSVPGEPGLIHSHLDGVANHLAAVQENALGAVLQRLDTVARDIHLLRTDFNAHNTHLQQLADRVAAIKESRSESLMTGEAAERRGGNLDAPGERQTTRSVGVQTAEQRDILFRGQNASVSHRNPVDAQPRPGPEVGFSGLGHPGSSNLSLRNPSDGQSKTRSKKRNHSRNSGPARNAGRGNIIAQQRVLPQAEGTIPSPQSEMVASSPQFSQYQNPYDVPQAFYRQFPPGPGWGPGLSPVLESPTTAPIPFTSMSTILDASEQQHSPRPRGPSTGGMTWSGTSDWYHRAYPANY